MGSDFRFDYTVLGDAVNLGARLEGQTKSYGTKIIIGKLTANAVKDHLAVLLIDRVRVKGKNEPEDIYALLGDEVTASSGSFQKLSKLHTSLLDAYFSQRWKIVGTIAAQCRDLAAEFDFEEFYEIYTRRAKEYSSNPPGKDWDGVNDILVK